MNKAVLMSIQPQWDKLIIDLLKNIDVRKTKPNIETSFKCYIYQTKSKDRLLQVVKEGDELYGDTYKGKPIFVTTPISIDEKDKKIIGEFICDKIYDITPHRDIPTFVNQYMFGWKENESECCLSFEELHKYLNGNKGYGWHISNLVIYDKPKELSKFKNLKGEQIKRAPQSWCYVQELESEE